MSWPEREKEEILPMGHGNTIIPFLPVPLSTRWVDMHTHTHSQCASPTPGAGNRTVSAMWHLIPFISASDVWVLWKIVKIVSFLHQYWVDENGVIYQKWNIWQERLPATFYYRPKYHGNTSSDIILRFWCWNLFLWIHFLGRCMCQNSPTPWGCPVLWKGRRKIHAERPPLLCWGTPLENTVWNTGTWQQILQSASCGLKCLPSR